MRFSIVAASLIAAVAAQYPAADETCSAAVTVTVTETMGSHTPIAPSSMSAYYPTTSAMSASATPLVPEASTVVSGMPPAGTGYPVAPIGSGTAAPSGTGAPYPEFTGAASGFKVGGALAGVAGVAAFLL